MVARKVTRAAIDVYLDASELGPLQQIGVLYTQDTRVDAAPSFEYSRDWLLGKQPFMLDPRLALYVGEQHPVSARGFGIFLDSAPDRWGRLLMERREVSLAKIEGRKPKRLTDVDFMLGVHDETRTGALRFRIEPDGAFLDDQAELAAPPMTSLAQLADVAKRIDQPGVEEMPEYERWLAMLVAPGTSLGGARPKATFRYPDGSLWLAKFPARDDRYDWEAWEYLTHQLAGQAGIDVPASQLLYLGDRYHTFCVKRFDRGIGDDPTARRMYSSAMTLLERMDGDAGGSYLDLVQVMEDQGGNGLTTDLKQLFRRAVFNLMMGNRDDHLRNHGFILTSSGWRLSQAFDMNPNRDKDFHVLTWDGESSEPDMQVLMATCDYYRLTPGMANTIVDEVRCAVSKWRIEAEKLSIPRLEIEMMGSVFQV